MKKEHLILLIATSVVLLVICLKKKKEVSTADVIMPGDKGSDIYALQYALSSMTGVKFSNMGAYDNYTQTAIQYYMEGSSALKDYEKGYVDRDFALNLLAIQSKLKKKD